MPSRFESFGYAALMAMALHRAVLTGNHGAPGTTWSMAAAASCVTRPRTSPSTSPGPRHDHAGPGAAAMGARAARIAQEQCDPDQAVSRLIIALDSVPAERTRRSFPVASARSSVSRSGRANCEPGLLTVVIPCHNLGAFVQEALDSVVASTYRLWRSSSSTTDPATRRLRPRSRASRSRTTTTSRCACSARPTKGCLHP